MASFPTRENDIVALADQMVTGLNIHGTDFPSVNGSTLAEALDNFRSLRGLQENARSEAKLATVTKDEELADLVELMKNDLKLAEVDVADDPEKLSEIGWGPRNQPTPIQSPESPTNLHPVSESEGEIWLSWDKPATDPNRPVTNYIVERAQAQESGSFGPFSLIETVYNNEAHLLEQPSNTRLLYRVKASNAAGESLPSNTVLVVLP